MPFNKTAFTRQRYDIFDEKIAQLKKEADEEIKRVINEDNRVSAPLSVVTIISVALSILLFFFGGLIVANGDLVQSEWLNKYIWTMIGIWAGGVGVTDWHPTYFATIRIEKKVTHPG